MGTLDKDTLSRLMDGEWGEINPSDCLAALGQCDVSRRRWARYHLARDLMRSEELEGGFSLADRVRRAIESEETYSNVANLPISPAEQARATRRVYEGSVPDKSPASDEPRDTHVGLPWRQGALGFALAASVAVVTVASVGFFNDGGSRSAVPDPMLASAPAPTDAAMMGADSSLASADTAAVGQPSERAATLPQVELAGNRSPGGAYWEVGPSGARMPQSQDAQMNWFYLKHIEAAPSGVVQGMLPYSRANGYERGDAGEPAERPIDEAPLEGIVPESLGSR